MTVFKSKAVQLKNVLLMAVCGFIILLLILWNSSFSNTQRYNANEENVQSIARVCAENVDDSRMHIQKDLVLNMIYFITPTYPRPEQLPELTRLSYTLMHVPRIHWIVADDRKSCNPLVERILRRTKLPFTYMTSPMPEQYRRANMPPRGVANRRQALHWIHGRVNEGVIYFGDDDNTFDLRLFNEIRTTKKISMFPVGLIGEYGISSPVVNDGKVVGFFDSWPAKRLWPVDMAGFAINVKFLKATAVMPYKAGFEEDQFLRNNNVTIEDIEPKANNCTKVYVWHTQTKKHPVSKIFMDLDSVTANPLFSNFVKLIAEATHQGMSILTSSKGAIPYITKDGKSVPLVNKGV